MRRRVEDTLDLLGLVELRDRPVSTLSGGQAQRVAIGAVLTAHPRVLVLDEPTSALDPAAAEDVLAAVQRLVHDLGLTVLMAEHRLERVVQHADTVLWLPGGGAPVERGEPRGDHGPQPDHPADRHARPGARLVAAAADRARRARHRPARCATGCRPTPAAIAGAAARCRRRRQPSGSPCATAGWSRCARSTMQVRRRRDRRADGTQRRRQVDPAQRADRAGRAGRPGPARVGGADPRALRGRELTRHVGLVPQQPGDLLYADTVAQECTQRRCRGRRRARDGARAAAPPRRRRSTCRCIRATCPRGSGWPSPSPSC